MFQKAVKRQAKLRLAIAGPSGSGKTYSSLAIGTALANGGRVAVVDTEHGSASKYADKFDFDVLEMQAPYHPDRFGEAIKAASQAGYDVVIIDSLSHAWNGEGGLLEIVEDASKRYRGNTYAAWGVGTPIQQRLIENILSAKLHVIIAMRSKQDYILVEKNGKQIPQKVGMAPIQRDGFEYEADVMIDMDIENNAIVQKTRCPALSGKVFSKPGKDLADVLADWLNGEPPKTEDDYFTDMLEANTVEAWASSAYQLKAYNIAFENAKRLIDWRGYVTGNGYNVADNAKLAQVGKDYCNALLDGVKVRDAAQKARDDFQPLFSEDEPVKERDADES